MKRVKKRNILNRIDDAINDRIDEVKEKNRQKKLAKMEKKEKDINVASKKKKDAIKIDKKKKKEKNEVIHETDSDLVKVAEIDQEDIVKEIFKKLAYYEKLNIIKNSNAK